MRSPGLVGGAPGNRQDIREDAAVQRHDDVIPAGCLPVREEPSVVYGRLEEISFTAAFRGLQPCLDLDGNQHVGAGNPVNPSMKAASGDAELHLILF